MGHKSDTYKEQSKWILSILLTYSQNFSYSALLHVICHIIFRIVFFLQLIIWIMDCNLMLQVLSIMNCNLILKVLSITGCKPTVASTKCNRL